MPSLLYYGITGLFLYPWSGIDRANQVMHVVMLADVIYFVSAALLRIQLIRLSFGLIFGIVLAAGVRFDQIRILYGNPGLSAKYLPKSARPVKRIKKSVKAGKKLLKKKAKAKLGK